MGNKIHSLLRPVRSAAFGAFGNIGWPVDEQEQIFTQRELDDMLGKGIVRSTLDTAWRTSMKAYGEGNSFTGNQILFRGMNALRKGEHSHVAFPPTLEKTGVAVMPDGAQQQFHAHVSTAPSNEYLGMHEITFSQYNAGQTAPALSKEEAFTVHHIGPDRYTVSFYAGERSREDVVRRLTAIGDAMKSITAGQSVDIQSLPGRALKTAGTGPDIAEPATN